MNILKLAAMLTLDGTRFKAGLKEAEVAANKAGKQIAGQLTSAFGFTALVYGAKRLIDFNSNIKDTATALDISTTSFQEQSYWLTQNGADAGDLILVYKGLAKARAEALSGGAGGAKKMGLFAAMGISESDLRSNSIETLFKSAAEAFRTTDFGSDKMAAAMEIFGKGATKILPALEESLAESADEAHRLGNVIDSDVNAALERLGDNIDQIAGASKNLFGTILYGVVRGLDAAFTTVAAALLYNFEKWSSVLGMSGKAGELKDARLDIWNGMLDRWDPSKSTKGKGRGNALFADSVANPENAGKGEERRSEKLASLEEKIWRLSFNRLGVDEKRAVLQAKIAKMLEEEEHLWFTKERRGENAAQAELDLNESIARRMELEDELNGLKDNTSKNQDSFATPGRSSLTGVGQWEGRAYVKSNDQGLSTLKEEVAQSKLAVKELQEINRKVKAGKTLTATL